MTPLRIPRVIKIIAIIYVTYLALVILIATPLVNIFTPKIYREQTGRELHIDKIIWLNPFALSFAVHGVASNNPDGSRLWAAESLYANVSLASVWQRHLVLDALSLQGLYAQIDQTSAERYNFSDILDYRAAQAAKNPSAVNEKKGNKEKTSALPAMTIHRFELSAAHLGIRAPYLSEPLAINVDNISLALDAFTTAVEKTANPNPALTASSGAFTGSIKTIEANFLREQQPFATQLRDLEIKFDKLSTAATDAEPFTIALRDGSNGTLQIKGHISLANKITMGTAQLRNIDLLPGWRYLANRLSFDMQSALLDGDINYNVNWSEALQYKISDSRANLHDVKLQSRADADTHISFHALNIEGLQVDSALPRAQIAKVMLDQPTINGWNRDKHMSLLDMLAFAGEDDKEPDAPSPWQIQIDEIDANGGGLNWRASQLDNLPMQLAPLDLQITNVRWPDPEALRVSFTSSLNDTSQLAVTGAIVPKNVNGNLDITLRALPLQWFNPLLKQQMQAKLVNGLLSAQTKLTLSDGKPVTVHTDGHIDQLELQQLPDHRKLVAWKQLQWHDLALDMQKQRMQLRRIDIVNPWAQFRINAGGTNNFQQLMAASDSTAKPTTTPSTAPRKTPPVNKSSDAWKFAVGMIHLDNASIDFRDNSLNKAFHTTITQLTGNIEALNNQTSKPARIAMKGTVDGYAPVALTGTAAPFINPPAVKVALDITNLDLATLTPYSGTYAGYLIDGGRLTVQLVYTLENERIQGTNHIVVNELRLGEQVSGPKVRDLPLRFAIYLLTDANGVMDLGVDVTGNVDDPDFSVGNIIWKAFRNLIFKTASSPFRVLARIAGGSEEDQLDRIEFEPGSDQIVHAHNDKLNKLVAALQKKSELNLVITGHVSPSQDLEALRDLTLNRELINDSKITNDDVRSQSAKWGQAVAKLFKKRYPEQNAAALQPMQMNDWIRDNIELPAIALQELASSRALTVKQELVAQHGLAPDRASIKPVDLGADDKPGRQVTMEVN